MRNHILVLTCIIGCGGVSLQTRSLAAQESNYRQPAWASVSEADSGQIETLSTGYKRFLGHGQHELRVVAEAERLAQAQGFRPVESLESLSPGDRVYAINRGRAMILAVIGQNPLTAGSVLVASHIDTPRIELKANPLYESEGFALFQTTYYGGIKNYQWASVPLAMVGRIHRSDGSTLDITFGLDGEPYLVIPDLAPHVDRDYRERTQQDVLKGEELDPVVGSRPDADGSVTGMVESVLREEYGVSMEDFVSAQLVLVPALPPADVGFDASMIGGFGHDDLLCSFAALRALFDTHMPERTAMVYLAANEEVGSHNVMGARSTYFADTLLALQEMRSGQSVSLRDHRSAMVSVHAISADVTTGVHPTFADVQESTNAARLGAGVVLKRYGRGTDPTSEMLARVRRVLDDNDIPWQTHTYKVDVGGGFTLGTYLSDDGMDTVDIGIPILAMHSTWSLASKVDLWSLYRYFLASYAQ